MALSSLEITRQSVQVRMQMSEQSASTVNDLYYACFLIQSEYHVPMKV